ncbi:MAG: GntR family transcriptional regulator [Thermoleophilia bacterium]|nr:GntR family transcriptional regulator [Thermoleophilia bacterium]
MREAIRELAREGLVVELARRGTVVSTLTARDLAEVYAVREALELGAAKIVAARASDDGLLALGAHLDAMERARGSGAGYLEVAAHDLAFHRGLVELAGNARMAATEEQMLSQTVLLLRTAAERNPTLRSELRPAAHRDILSALLERDPGRIQATIEAHYRYAEERLFAGLAGVGAAG